MKLSTVLPPRIRVSCTVLNKLAVMAGREVPGIEDVERVFCGAGIEDGPVMVLRLHLTVKPGADFNRLRDAVRQRVFDKIRQFTGIELGVVEVELV